MLVIAALMSASLGFLFFSIKAAAVMIMPLWQKPHCGTCNCTHAFCTGCDLPSADNASMVVIFLPVMADHFADTMQYMDPEQAAKLSRYDRDEYYP